MAKYLVKNITWYYKNLYFVIFYLFFVIIMYLNPRKNGDRQPLHWMYLFAIGLGPVRRQG